MDLRRKNQSQWHFKNKSEARRELNFQKRYNPDTHKWLLTKNIEVGGKMIPTKSVTITKKKTRRPTNPLGFTGFRMPKFRGF